MHRLSKITYPTIDNAGDVPLDVDKLVATRALVVANSGAGKGWFLRRLLEQSYGHTQQGAVAELTAAGRVALGAYQPLPTGRAMRERIFASNDHSKCDLAILAAVLDAYPQSMSRESAIEAAGYRRSGSTTDAFSKWIKWGYIVKLPGGKVQGSKELIG